MISEAIKKIRDIQGGKDWVFVLTLAIVLGYATVIYYGFQSHKMERLTAALLLTGSALLVGVLIGFLFGIPRSLQGEGAPAQKPAPAPAGQAAANSHENDERQLSYKANTNLEQISDWLTKILVGVGLTQLTNLPDLFDRAGNYFGPAVGEGPAGARIAIGIIIFFSVCGFLYGYLWTRLFLMGELVRADRIAIAESLKRLEAAKEEQEQIDARAISLATQYLTADDVSKISLEELKNAIVQASAPVKTALFYRAQEIRGRNWKDNSDKPTMERSIPIFEALVASDRDKKFHQNFGQLGFALKDKRSPDYAKAEAALTNAIEARGSPAEYGWQLYEFNRAHTRIKQDPDFAEGRPSTPERKKTILADLEVAMTAIPHLYDEPTILKWRQLNAPERLKRAAPKI